MNLHPNIGSILIEAVLASIYYTCSTENISISKPSTIIIFRHIIYKCDANILSTIKNACTGLHLRIIAKAFLANRRTAQSVLNGSLISWDLA